MGNGLHSRNRRRGLHAAVSNSTHSPNACRSIACSLVRPNDLSHHRTLLSTTRRWSARDAAAHWTAVVVQQAAAAAAAAVTVAATVATIDDSCTDNADADDGAERAFDAAVDVDRANGLAHRRQRRRRSTNGRQLREPVVR